MYHQVEEGDVLAEVHHNGKLSEPLTTRIKEAFIISENYYPINRIIAIVSD